MSSILCQVQSVLHSLPKYKVPALLYHRTGITILHYSTEYFFLTQNTVCLPFSAKVRNVRHPLQKCRVSTIIQQSTELPQLSVKVHNVCCSLPKYRASTILRPSVQYVECPSFSSEDRMSVLLHSGGNGRSTQHSRWVIRPTRRTARNFIFYR